MSIKLVFDVKKGTTRPPPPPLLLIYFKRAFLRGKRVKYKI
jgi:hypothetical protein